MSHGLAPSRSTVYVSNLPFDLKNNDLHKIFEKHGKIVKVTVLKDRETRRSRGVAFVLFLNKEDAQKCADATNQQEMFGRTLKASIAKDNGRSTEFIRRKDYVDKTQCYECGEPGHLSYKCSKNLLGDREPPPKKVRKRKKRGDAEKSDDKERFDYYSSDEDRYDETKKREETAEPDDETLSAAIASEQEKQELERYRLKVATGNYSDDERTSERQRKRIKKSAYFSDEEETE